MIVKVLFNDGIIDYINLAGVSLEDLKAGAGLFEILEFIHC